MNLPITVPSDVQAVKNMSVAKREDLKSAINSTDPHHIFQSAGDSRNPDKRKIICPNCGNGSGDDATPVEVTCVGDVWLYHCFKGNDLEGDLLKIIATEEHLNLNQFEDMCTALAVGARLIGHNLEILSSHKPKQTSQKNNDIELNKEHDFILADIAEARQHLKELLEPQRRGLTLETLIHFGCGYLPTWIHPSIRAKIEVKNYFNDKGEVKQLPPSSRRIIIPTDCHYNAVAISAERANMEKKYHKMHAGKMELFNARVIKFADVVLILEGEFDAMSIWQASAGKIAAVATLGAANWKATLTPHFKICARKKFIILFDYDDAGKSNSENLRGELLKRKIPAISKFLYDYLSNDQQKIFGKKVDANQILQARGNQFLNNIITNIIVDARADFEVVDKEIASAILTDDDVSDDMTQYLFGFNTDLGNAERLKKFCGKSIRWLTDSERWLIWQKTGVWRLYSEKNSCLNPFVKQLADKLTKHARKLKKSEDEKEQEQAKTFYGLSLAFQKAKYVNPAIFMLKGFDSILITRNDLDQHKNLLNCKNGVIDLQTGKFYPHRAADLITQQTRAYYRPNFHDDIVENFLKSIMPNEADLEALLRWLGYCLTGEISEQCAHFWTGLGSNGKSTLLDFLLYLLGDYATKLSVKAVVESREADANATTTHLNCLVGKRIAIVNEFKPNHRLDVQIFKDLTGDRFLDIRRLHHERETIELLAKLILNGNELPYLNNADSYALKRRIRTLRFEQIFSIAIGNLDPFLSKKLATPEACAGMLSILVPQAVAWYRDSATNGTGLLETNAMKAAKKEYLSENDFVEEFISENCTFKNQTAEITLKDFVERLKTAYPSETLDSRIRKKDLLSMIQAKMESHGASYTALRTNKRGFKGAGWLITDDFKGTPIDETDIPL